jgi:hypothetical protein
MPVPRQRCFLRRWWRRCAVHGHAQEGQGTTIGGTACRQRTQARLYLLQVRGRVTNKQSELCWRATFLRRQRRCWAIHGWWIFDVGVSLGQARAAAVGDRVPSCGGEGCEWGKNKIFLCHLRIIWNSGGPAALLRLRDQFMPSRWDRTIEKENIDVDTVWVELCARVWLYIYIYYIYIYRQLLGAFGFRRSSKIGFNSVSGV